jgi:hypothetical protein
VASTTQAKPTVVLVNGAWANNASWSRVIKRLPNDGYSVVAPPNPLQSLNGDAGDRLPPADDSRPDRPCRPLLRRHGDLERGHRKPEREERSSTSTPSFRMRASLRSVSTPASQARCWGRGRRTPCSTSCRSRSGSGRCACM